MKKNLLYLFALICSVSLFTACSDDDDNSWQELPKGEIKAENVDFQLNGTNTTGTVNFEATSLQSATVGFKNVVDCYNGKTGGWFFQIQWNERYHDKTCDKRNISTGSIIESYS